MRMTSFLDCWLKWKTHHKNTRNEIRDSKRKFVDNTRAVSWRWQALDGGMNFQKRTHKIPGKGTEFDAKTSLLIFHGNPKPDQVTDPVVQSHWR